MEAVNTTKVGVEFVGAEFVPDERFCRLVLLFGRQCRENLLLPLQT